jgi:hypothetical protein
LLDHEPIYFPEPEAVQRFTMEFMRMMFAQSVAR